MLRRVCVATFYAIMKNAAIGCAALRTAGDEAVAVEIVRSLPDNYRLQAVTRSDSCPGLVKT